MRNHTLMGLVFALGLIAAGAASAATIEGPLDAVTGVSDLTFTSNGHSYDVNVSFVSGASYSSAYGTSTPLFVGNATDAQAAAVATILAFRSALATGLTGGVPDFLVPYAVDTAQVSAIVGGSPGVDNTGNTIWTTFGGAFFSPNSPPTQAEWAVITPVPLPAAAWLLLSGLGGMGFLRRQRTSART